MRSNLFFAVLIALFASTVGAQEVPPADPVADEDAATIQDWIERLESKRYAVRNEAMSQLQRSGIAVIDELEKIALQGSTESADRAFEVLRRHHRSGNTALKEAAAEKLKRIAATDGHAKAKMAEEILNPKPKREQPNLRIPNLGLAPGNIQIRMQNQMIIGGGKNAKTTRVKIVNGKKDVTIEENGEKVRIVEDEKGIRVEKTDANGKTETKQYKDLEELKKKDPQSRETFDGAGGAGQRIQIRFGAPRAGNPAIPVIPRAAPPMQRDFQRRIEEMRKEQQKRVEEMRRQRDEAIERLQRSREGRGLIPAQPPKLPQPIEVKTPDVIEV